MTDGDISPLWVEIKDGEWAGWLNWPTDKWEMHGGPYYMKREADGSVRCAFRAEAKHMNGQGHMHGGAMMTFADFALFAVAAHVLDGPTVTVSMNCEFVSAAQIGDLVEATGEVTKTGRTLVFQRGLLSTGGRTLMTFSGVLMRVGKR